jgi:hypothetical protein
MCFYHDGDWRATINKEEDRVVATDKKVACTECRRQIPVGENYKYLFQQEYDPDGWDEDGEGEPFHPGETFECRTCSWCRKLIQAIESVEVQRGCPAHASRPPDGQLMEEMGEICVDDLRAYRQRALEMFPDLDREHFDRVMKTWRVEEETS